MINSGIRNNKIDRININMKIESKIKIIDEIMERLKDWEWLMKEIKSERSIIIDNIFILIDKILFFNEK